jgi:hypothetical protein
MQSSWCVHFFATTFFSHSGACLMQLDRCGRVGVDSTVGDGTTVAPAQGSPVATCGGELAFGFEANCMGFLPGYN